MTAFTNHLMDMGEYFAAGYLTETGTPMQRFSNAVKTRWQYEPVNVYQGESLFPVGPRDRKVNRIMTPQYSFTFVFDQGAAAAMLTQPGADTETINTLCAALDDLEQAYHVMDTLHTVGGGGYTHSILNFGRVAGRA